ncbi:hypothetical protein [Photobacterium galatheae]|nr:hypothetical protein [Photobacterium galatheae]MCM0150469.1 hypothetical protein [Photobacterium galatheae]
MAGFNGENGMGCCNQAPKGGSNQLGLLVKGVLGLAVVIVVLAVAFG